jgi:hypothetical protein
MHAFQIETLGYAIESGIKINEFPITYAAGKSSLKLRDVDEAIREGLWILNR